MNRPINLSKRRIIIASAILLILAAAIIACVVYLGDYYRADIPAIQAFLPQGIQWTEEPDGTIVFSPEDPSPDKGFIFYPGGKVEHTAYLPLMQTLSEQGILCVLVKMPFHLAVFDMAAADGIPEQYPGIENWYIGGHSLGGAMAASYVDTHADRYDGLVLLGAYSTADLSDTDLSVLSVYGSEDAVLNRETYEQCRSNLPKTFYETVIEGGCHAYFGAYGAQAGDGIPTVTWEEQIAYTADAIVYMMEQTP